MMLVHQSTMDDEPAEKDKGRGWWLIPIVLLLGVWAFFAWLDSGSRDWLQEADDATTCVEATQLIGDYVSSDDDNGLRGSGTHGYLVDRRDVLCA